MAVGTPVRLKRAQIACREESVEGTAESLANTYADLKAENITITPDLPFFPRAATSSSFSQFAGTSGGPRMCELAFEVGIAGSGAAGTAPSWGPLLKGSGMYESLIAATSATYGPRTARPETTVSGQSNGGQKVLLVASTTGFYGGDLIWTNEGGARAEVGVVDTVQAGVSLTLITNLTNTHTALQADAVYPYPGSVTLGWYVDGLLYQLVGARGKPKMTLNAGEPGKLGFSFRGVYAPSTDVDLLTGIAYESTIPPAILNGSFTLDSQSLKYKSCEIDFGNVLADRPNPSATHGGTSVFIARREPVGSLDPEMLAYATYRFFNQMTTNQQGAFSLAIGATAGNIVTASAPKCQYSAVAPGDRDGAQVAGLSLRLNMASSSVLDDEMTIVNT